MYFSGCQEERLKLVLEGDRVMSALSLASEYASHDRVHDIVKKLYQSSASVMFIYLQARCTLT